MPSLMHPTPPHLPSHQTILRPLVFFLFSPCVRRTLFARGRV